MAEYIDREALYEKAYWHGEHPDVGNPFPDGVDAIDIKDVDAIPAADVAPVVRCKDCKFSHADGHGRTCEGYWFELSEYAVSVKDDAFCSYGDRRDKP